MINLILFVSSFLPLFKNPVTSTFGENRDGRYHLGIDFSTFKKDGFPLYFPFETEIIRLRVVFNGYGKVLYLKDKNGFIYVLAHLQRFNDFIDSLVFERLKKEEVNEIDLWFDEEIKIKPYDTICYTGHSGASIPHLHLEIRKNMDIALNPLKFINIQDTIPPFIHKVLLIPIGKSIINSSYFPIMITKSVKEVYGKGEFFIWVKCFDRQDEYNTIAPYLIKILKNDSLIFFIKMDSIVIPEQNEAIKIYYKDGNSFSKSWIHPFYTALNINGEEKIKVIAEDYNGNKDSILFKIKDEIPEKIMREAKIPATFYSFDGIVFRTSKDIKSVYALIEDKKTEIDPFDTPFYREFKWIPPFGFEGEVEFIFEGNKEFSKKYYVLLCENSLKSRKINDIYIKYKGFFPFYFYLDIHDKKIELLPYFAIFDELIIKRELKEKEYWLSKGKFAGREYIETKRGGIFETETDTLPPFFKGDTLIYSSNPFYINFYIYDNESGIDRESIKFYIDDEFIPVFYYPSDGKIEIFKKINLKEGKHKFFLLFSDRVGNYSKISGKIFIR